ncbi:tubulin polyglutamylase TTLL13P-like isoform X2 [Zootermopsis nevadensis]|uniref:tubulin polyglutamylase TTLL13P-like isoform X2 n=1 Tax=Zootermopsis nevadensis TaxID=136037 RepID=UPI000B8E5CEA|nr:tubulin polyglutamylase TTLL13P-like isoform X2 [Zootermopsis nevadensis]
MNGGRRTVRPSRIIELMNRQISSNESDSQEQHNHVPYITTADDRTVDEALTLVDVYDIPKFSASQESCVLEDFSLDSGEEKEYQHNAQITKQCEGPSHMPQKSPVHKKITIKNNKKFFLNGGRKGRWKKKKKKRKCRVTICTENCKYEVVRQVAMKLGIRDVGEDDSWNVYWTDLSVTVEKAKEMKRFQKINHFPGMLEICRKDLLARNLNRMLKMFPNEYNFFPKTWCLPADYRELVAHAQSKRNRTYICKPETGSQGRGIYVTKHVKEIKPQDKLVCQVYISKPFLVDGFKFDLRLYVLITSCDPLRIYVYNEGLVRFATSRYQEPSDTNTSNVFMHLTNYAVNKYSHTYVVDDKAGSKRKISTLNNWLLKKDYNVHEMWSNIDDVIVKTVIAAHPTLKHNYHACFPAHDFTYACFELLGFDILLDYKLKPYILEVNHSPSFHTDAQIDHDIKESLLQDTFIILNLAQADKKKVIEEDRKRVHERLLHGINHKESEHGNNVNSGSSPQDHWKIQVAWEESHLGNFRCIYPYLGFERYECYFHQNQSSLFQDTAASRAREECARIQREELEAKANAASCKTAWKNKDFGKLQPESPLKREKKPVTALQKRHMLLKNKHVAEKKQSFLNSFEPSPIIESEEMSRRIAMAQRDFLMKSFKITEQIIRAMKRNGNLRLFDEKFNICGKLPKILKSEDKDSNKLPSMFPKFGKPHFPPWLSGNSFYINSIPRPVNNEGAVAPTSTDRMQHINSSSQLQPLGETGMGLGPIPGPGKP